MVCCDGKWAPRWRVLRDNRIRNSVGAALMATKKKWRPGEYRAIMESMLSPDAFVSYNKACKKERNRDNSKPKPS
jgi:hypothetical protein